MSPYNQVEQAHLSRHIERHENASSFWGRAATIAIMGAVVAAGAAFALHAGLFGSSLATAGAFDMGAALGAGKLVVSQATAIATGIAAGLGALGVLTGVTSMFTSDEAYISRMEQQDLQRESIENARTRARSLSRAREQMFNVSAEETAQLNARLAQGGQGRQANFREAYMAEQQNIEQGRS